MLEKYVGGTDDFLLQLIFDFLVELIEGASISLLQGGAEEINWHFF